MENDRYVAAIEIGSSKIIAAVGKTDGKGLDIVAVEQIKTCDIVRYGVIQNLEATANAIKDVIDRLEAHPEIAPRRINSLFVGISGRSMRSIPVDVELNLHEEKEIDAEDLKQLRHLAEESAIDSSMKMIDVVPRKYRLGKTFTHNPIGMYGVKLEATYDLIACRPVLERNLTRTISDKLDIEIANFVVTPLAMGHLLVLPDEKRVGCMLVDIGAETTTVIIFKNGEMVYYATIPLGSRNITMDLMSSLKLSEEKAESIKQQSGRAIAPETRSTISIEGIRHSEIINIVVARAEEIAANICEQIHYANLDHTELPGGIIAVGEGFKLTDMVELVGKQCNLSIRSAKLPANGIALEDHKAPANDLLQVASILYTGATHTDTACLEDVNTRSALPSNGIPNADEVVKTPDTETKEPERVKKTKSQGIFGRLKTRFLDAIQYGPDDENDPEIE
jgi:cell division protein FtsA